MKTFEAIVSKPIFFERNRVFRVYKGGKLFHNFFGDEATDGNFPEEWIASTVNALNKEPNGEREGISRVEGTDVYLDYLVTQFKEQMLGKRECFDVLVKVLDSAIRLPAQVHPDKQFSRKYLNSDYGKTEMWLILGTREGAGIYYGFKEGVTKEDLISAIEKSVYDKGAMELLMNYVSVKTGEVYLIPAKIIHAIGYGCLILEVQEPTDFTIQPEAWCGEYRLSDYEMYIGLDKKVALESFDFSMQGQKALSIGKKCPAILKKDTGILSESLISYSDTPCFEVNRHHLINNSMKLQNAPAVYIIISGEGCLCGKGYNRAINKGDYFFLPFAAGGRFDVQTDTQIEIVECLPSELI